MNVVVVANFDSMSAEVAKMVFAQIVRKPDSVLGLATGSTPLGVYSLLAEYHARGTDFSRLTTFNLDEYVGLAPDHPQSYHWYMRENFFSKVNIKPDRIFIPNGMAEDLEAECLRYDELIKQAGGIDLQLLGIGKAGHIGFNEPLSALRSRTRVKALTPTTLKQNAPFFGGENKMPRRAITMGVGTIIEARRCILLATGESKARVLAQAVEGPITSMVSASALQLHPRCTVVVDEEAAAFLQEKDYYRWIFENEPEWQEYR